MNELGQVAAVNGKTATFTLPAGAETLIVENQLGAVIFAAYGRAPSATDFDFVVPGSSLFQLPLAGGERVLNVLVAYPGAVPATDVAALFWTTERCWPVFVGAIA